MMEKEFAERINLNTDLANISKQICEKYCLEEYFSDTIITVGYEDFSYILETSSGKYCVKIFNKERTDKDCENYVSRMEVASTLDINTPKVYKVNEKSQCDIVLENIKYRLCVCEYIEGKTFYDMGIKPNESEIKEIVRQMSNIHKTIFNPDFIYDTWIITNFKQEFEDKKTYLNNRDLLKLEELLNRYEKINIQKLPYTFIHGDIISSNIIKDRNDKLWLIDFASSNYLPRMIDLAVSACDLCLDVTNKGKTISKIKTLLVEYEKYNKLTEYEKKVFPLFFDLVNAIGILQISYLTSKQEASAEDKLAYNESKIGLEFSDKEFWTSIFGK